MDNKTYLADLPSDVVYEMITGVSVIENRIYNSLAEINGDLAIETFKNIVGRKTYDEDIKFDDTSYTWYANIKERHYKGMLDLNLDYMSDQDAAEIEGLQKELKVVVDKIDNLEDCDDFYYRLYEMKNWADEIADQILQTIVREIKRLEEVTTDQVRDEIRQGNYIEEYYILNNDKSRIYHDCTEIFNTNYKEN